MVFGRLEEFNTDTGWPKTFDAVPSGSHKAGEEYLGCYGFRWTFTHDSYGYTAFCDNNSPDSGIEEAEIPTVLLSEAATAREAMVILTMIYLRPGLIMPGA